MIGIFAPWRFYAALFNDPALSAVHAELVKIEAEGGALAVPVPEETIRAKGGDLAKARAHWLEGLRHSLIIINAEAQAYRRAHAAAWAEIRTLRRDLAERGDFARLEDSRRRAGDETGRIA